MLSYLFSNPLSFVFYLASLIIALTIHEFAHAWMADRLGDPTAKLQGRLSLNPLVHIDPLGALFLVIAGFGWGKPVQFDPFNLKNPRQDAAKIALAGPLSNIALAVVLSLVLRLFILFKLSNLFVIGLIILQPLIVLNIILGLFNFIPIFPLDGYNIVGGLLSRERAREWEGLRRYGFFFLILLIIPFNGSSMLSAFLQPAASFLIKLLVPGLHAGGVI